MNSFLPQFFFHWQEIIDEKWPTSSNLPDYFTVPLKNQKTPNASNSILNTNIHNRGKQIPRILLIHIHFIERNLLCIINVNEKLSFPLHYSPIVHPLFTVQTYFSKSKSSNQFTPTLNLYHNHGLFAPKHHEIHDYFPVEWSEHSLSYLSQYITLIHNDI